jgi:predicted RNase H-like HicB family nuclease
VTKPEDAIDVTVVYEDAGAGWLTASIPVVPGTISTGRTHAEARGNVIDALRTMLSVEPENVPIHATAERVRIALAVARRQTRVLELDRSSANPARNALQPMAGSPLHSPARGPPSVQTRRRLRGYVPFSVPQPPQTAS